MPRPSRVKKPPAHYNTPGVTARPESIVLDFTSLENVDLQSIDDTIAVGCKPLALQIIP